MSDLNRRPRVVVGIVEVLSEGLGPLTVTRPKGTVNTFELNWPKFTITIEGIQIVDHNLPPNIGTVTLRSLVTGKLLLSLQGGKLFIPQGSDVEQKLD